jgi:7,8-dihydro-6-hydroxymethylpterin dimethyltransferase
VALIQIVQSCNLSCPVCFADSPQKHAIDALSFDDFCQRVTPVTRRKGKIDILQLSGGEPTIHPEFFRLLEWALDNSEVGHVLLNTNGIKLTSDAFFASLSQLRQQYGSGGPIAGANPSGGFYAAALRRSQLPHGRLSLAAR